MPYDLTGQSLTPLSELISEAEFPLSEYLPLDEIASIFTSLYVAEHSFIFSDENLVLDCHLAFESELSLGLPGAESFALVLGSAGPGWTAVRMVLTIGPDFGLELSDLSLGLRFDPSVLCDPDTGAPAELSFTCTITIDAEGVHVSDRSGLNLSKSALCGTSIVVEASNVLLVLDGDERPDFLADQEEFRGVAFESLEVSIPSKYLDLPKGQDLDLTIDNGAIGTTGFTGDTRLAIGEGGGVIGSFLGFKSRIKSFELELFENSLVAANLELDIRLEALESDKDEKWISVDIAFDQSGAFSAQASAVQPADSSTEPDALVTLDYPDAVKLALNGLRITRENAAAGDVWAVYFSGDVKVLVPGAKWPKIGFDEIGVDSKGTLLLPEGGGITFASPLIVEWHFARLTIPKFRFGRPQGSDSLLQIQLSAQIDLLKGLPAGASVEGLTVTWDPSGNVTPNVSFTGIALEVASPGVFRAGIDLSFTQDGGSTEFRGQGHLELSSLDMAMQIGVTVGHDKSEDFSYLYLFADAKLLPTGIPIGSSGLSVYGFQGLIAYNMALAVNTSIPEDERYYDLFVRRPMGITAVEKWKKDEGQNALGIGVVLGTADKGFAFNVKGLFAVAFPDLVLLLQARANFIKTKPDLTTSSQGTMDALMVYDSVQNTFTFDVIASWGISNIVEVAGSARVFFDFDDPSAFYLRIGEDEPNKRVSANVVRWGGKWLFTAGFWFELDGKGVLTGFLIEVSLRYEGGGFWIEAIGQARGEMKLFWEPAQWEGSLALSGRIGAGYRGLSVGISFGGAASVGIRKPTHVRVHAQACIKALFWKACVGHTFKWERLDRPELENPIRSLAATPRDWTLEIPTSVAKKADKKVIANDGIVALLPPETTDHVQPHSVLSIDFAKPMIDHTGRFNEAVSLPNGGFLTVGENSGYAAAYELVAVSLTRDPEGEANPVDVWGVWAQETPNYNTSLRLLSSVRFGHDGSLTESFSDGVELDYCGEIEDRRTCLSLEGLTPGYGWFGGRYPYHWDTSKSSDPFEDRRNEPFLELLYGDRLSIFFPRGFTDIVFNTVECPRPSAHSSLIEDSQQKDHEPSIGRAIPVPRSVARSNQVSQTDDLKSKTPFESWEDDDDVSEAITVELDEHGETDEFEPKIPPEGRDNDDVPKEIPAEVGEHGESTVSNIITRRICLDSVCFNPGHDSPKYVTGKHVGGLLTQNEVWTVPPEARLLKPGETYELAVEVRTKLRSPDGVEHEVPGGQAPWTTLFTVAGPPSYLNALDAYVAATYPSAGARPIYTGYDISIRFVDDYVKYLYLGAKQELMVCLFDGQGRPVLDTNGDPVLLPVAKNGRPDKSLSEVYWEKQHLLNVEKGCIAKELNEQVWETIFSLPASSISLSKNSQYVAQLVSDAKINLPLYSWTFTTSAFATFEELVTKDRIVAPPRPVAEPGSANSFEELCRQFGIDTVASSDRTTLTPLVSIDRGRLFAVLLEAPEPLDASNRLSLSVDGGAVSVVSNLDETRLLITKPDGEWPTGTHKLHLSWSRGQPGDPPETLRAIDGALGNEEIDIEFSSGGF